MQASPRQVRVAVLGAGGLGKAAARIIGRKRELTLTAMCDSRGILFAPEGLDAEFLARSFREAHIRSYVNLRMFRRHLRMIRGPRDVVRYAKACWTVLRMALAATNPRRLFEVKTA